MSKNSKQVEKRADKKQKSQAPDKSSSKKRTLFASVAYQKIKAKACGYCHKSGHTTENCWHNSANPNNKLSEKEKAAILAALSKESSNKNSNKDSNVHFEISCDSMILRPYEAVKRRNLKQLGDYQVLNKKYMFALIAVLHIVLFEVRVKLYRILIRRDRVYSQNVCWKLKMSRMAEDTLKYWEIQLLGSVKVEKLNNTLISVGHV